jgi:uncharacterized protein YndB with AHSA1/START domain
MTTKPTASNRHGSAVVTLPSDTEYVITRAFDAPAELVFDALTTPELVKRWWGFETSEWLVCEIDLREGGRWRYVIREHDDIEVGFHGEYREISRPHRLVWTEMYEGVPNPGPDKYPVCTTTLEELDGVTTLTTVVQHTSKEDRDAVLSSGMESGMQISYDRLEDLVREGA